MYQIIKKNWAKTKHLMLLISLAILLLLLTVVYKSDEKIIKKTEITVRFDQNLDLKNFKEFLLNQIKSPFINLEYEISKGDTIQKILKKYKIPNIEVGTIINQYKKYGNPNQLLVGNKIDIIIEKGAKTEKNSIMKFSVPITKSTTIAITKNEENKIISEKIITKLYKKKPSLKI